MDSYKERISSSSKEEVVSGGGNGELVPEDVLELEDSEAVEIGADEDSPVL